MTQSISYKRHYPYPILLALALLLSLLPLRAAASGSASIAFSNGAIAASGSGYEISGTDLTITQAGTYTISGSCAEGSITVKKELSDVTLVLNGLTLSSSKTSPITCNKSSSVRLEIQGANTITDLENPADDGVSALYEGAGIKVKTAAKLHISGSGTLTVLGSCNNGIKGAAEAAITVSGATLIIDAVNSALCSDGSLTVSDGTLKLSAKEDGMKSDPNAEDTASAGTVTITGGTIAIVSGLDGLQAAGALSISGGSLSIASGGGCTATLDDLTSAKGIKSGTSIHISGGSFQLDCADDAIHAPEVTLTNGSYNIASSDDAVHADHTLTLGTKDSSLGPDLTVSQSYEGFEATSIALYSGTGTISSSDDGMNAADSSAQSDTFDISVYGGTWSVNAGGDGLDSNRNISFYGGLVEVYGSAGGADTAIDCDGLCVYEGGTLIAVSMGQMAQAPSTGVSLSFGVSGMGGGRPTGTTPDANGEATQAPRTRPEGTEAMQKPTDGTPPTGVSPEGMPTDLPRVDSGSVSITQGSELSIADSRGKVLYSTTGQKNANSVIFCSAEVVSGESYTLSVDGRAVETKDAATGSGSRVGPSVPAPAEAGIPIYPFVITLAALAIVLLFVLHKRKAA